VSVGAAGVEVESAVGEGGLFAGLTELAVFVATSCGTGVADAPGAVPLRSVQLIRNRKTIKNTKSWFFIFNFPLRRGRR
jgi:hypothetical protein